MAQSAIFGPVLALLMLTALVWIYLFVKRIPWIQSIELTPEQMRPGTFEQAQPDDVFNPSANFKNLFEVPVLFYVFAGLIYMAGAVDMIYLMGSWAFVASRYVHSLIHCTFNHVLSRFVVYAIGTVVLFLMIGRATIGYFL